MVTPQKKGPKVDINIAKAFNENEINENSEYDFKEKKDEMNETNDQFKTTQATTFNQSQSN